MSDDELAMTFTFQWLYSQLDEQIAIDWGNQSGDAKRVFDFGYIT